MAGSHYNRAWSLHSVFSEVLQRLLMTRFINEKRPYISTKLNDYCAEGVSSPADEAVAQSPRFLDSYDEYRKTAAEYWLMYLNLMRVQSLGLADMHQNDLELLIRAWKTFPPFYFAMKKVNYARYESLAFKFFFLKNDKEYSGQ